MNIGIIGSGIVAKTLAKGFLAHGYPVMVSSRDAEKQAHLQEEIGGEIKTGNFDEAAEFAEVIVLAVKGSGAVSALGLINPDYISGKTIIDTTNPISESSSPVNGVLQFFTGPNQSLMEQLQLAFPWAHFVKAFNSIGNAYMVDPDFEGGPPTMFICGNDAEAKKTVTNILIEFGFDVEDMGAVEAARAIEPLCILWCIPGFIGKGWDHAFKLLRN